jgi:hypothetical protein
VEPGEVEPGEVEPFEYDQYTIAIKKIIIINETNPNPNTIAALRGILYILNSDFNSSTEE